MAPPASNAAHPETSPSIPPAIARQAVHWLLELQPGDTAAMETTRQQWQTWLAANPLHAQAWRRIAEVDGQLRGVPAAVALQTLAAPGMQRRHAVRLAVLLTAGTSGLLAVRQTGLGAQAWQRLAADLSTTTGKRRDAVLADGTRVWLNTASAVDVRYSATERLIVLRAGEILVQSAPDPAPDGTTGNARPLVVRTAEGRVHPIGTRFTVRQHAGLTEVGVLQGTVELRPTHGMQGPHGAMRLNAGEQARFDVHTTMAAQPLHAHASAWSGGMLVADNQTLGDFLTELARHRPGVLHCAPEVAGLRLSGAYPLADTDRVLTALTLSLPVQIHTRTRWWVTVGPLG